MNGKPDYDILVVGGGMVGSTAALGLARQGWRVGLIEAATWDSLAAPVAPINSVTDFEPRVSAISAASQSLLKQLDVWPAIAGERRCAYTRMVVWDGDGTGRIAFDASELQAPALGMIMENRILIRGLFLTLRANAVDVLDGASVSGWWEEGAQRGITLDSGRRLSASLIVAADGPQSRLRQWAGMPTREWDYDQQSIVCTVATAQSHEFTAWQRFSKTGPLAFLPLQTDDGATRFSSIVWSQDTHEAQRLMSLDDEAFVTELNAAIEQQLGAIHAVSARHAFPLRQRHAKDYVRPGMVLIGDAAHTIHPLAGQGVNLGFSDVRVLLEELAVARETGRSPDEPAMLARYQRRRKGENISMMAAMEGFKRLFANEELPLRWLRNAGMRFLDRRGSLKNRIAAQAMGLNVTASVNSRIDPDSPRL
ncbi:MAG: 2-octaprenyl-3-methyl-6-methoxy-1,4-benzoquinol hydroxylase [Alteromonadaceae bacterium]|nr:2-octaprenyl-3-methyl-6-methoxy-1,4-benzoquinol hydroxylase [Alteromonadaceae bacterium]|tara:strand:+ start:37356 stop:38624 length:1269 start_codon:yes stop_codon:yes gene_type:complete